MQQNDGKHLENLVYELERVIEATGRRVDINQKEYDDNGVQIAEFDIVVSSGSGNKEVKWFIECRDRPSQGKAPKAWIEQLYGRKCLNDFDRAIAVSTTGFSPGAIHLAQKGNIELRTAEELLHPEMWLCNTLIIYRKTGTFAAMEVNPIDMSEEMRHFLNTHLPEHANEVLLYFEFLPDPVRPFEMFEGACQNEKYGIYNGLMPGETRHIKVQYVSGEGDIGAVSLKLNRKNIPLDSIILSGEIEIDEYEEPFTSIHALKNMTDDSLIGQRIIIDSSSGAFDTMTFYETVNEDGSRKLTLKVKKEVL